MSANKHLLGQHCKITTSLDVQGTTASTSTSTGAIITSGGVGIAKDLNLGASIQRVSQEFATYDATTTPLTADNTAIPIAQIQQGTAVITPTAAHTKATPSASALITGLAFTDATARPTNTQYIWTVNNLADTSSNNLTFTLSAGASVTIPTGQNMTIGAGRSGSFLFTITGASTVTVRRLNDSTEGFTSNAPVAISQVLETITPEVLVDDTSAIPASAIQAGLMTITPASTQTKALPTATAILDAFLSATLTRPQVGRRIRFKIANLAPAVSARWLTLTAGTGTTLKTGRLLVPSWTTGEFIYEVTNIGTPAVNLYGVSDLADDGGATILRTSALRIATTSSSTSAMRILTEGNGTLFTADTTNSIIEIQNCRGGNACAIRLDGSSNATSRFLIEDTDPGQALLKKDTVVGTPSGVITIVVVPQAGANTGTIEFFRTSSGAGTTNQWDIYDNTTLVTRLSRAVGGSTDAPVTLSGIGTTGILNIYGSDTSGKNLILGANSASLSTGQINILTTTQATSTTVGSLTTAGGAGIAKNLFIGGTGNIAGITTVSNTTDTTTSTDGALIVSGGVGIAKSLNVDNKTGLGVALDTNYTLNVGAGSTVATQKHVNVSGNMTVGTTGASMISMHVNPSTFTLASTASQTHTIISSLALAPPTSVTSTQATSVITNYATLYISAAMPAVGGSGATITTGPYALFIAAGTTKLADTTTSTSTSTGALRVSGGVGIAENLFIGGTLNTTGATTLSGGLAVTGAISLTTNLNGTGAGLTIFGAAVSGTNLVLRANSADTTTGQVFISTTTASTSTATGALNVLGGVGIVGNLHVGGTINVPTSINGTGAGLTIYGGDATTESLTLRANSADTTTGSVSITTSTASTSSSTGALKVSGGVGITGNLHVGGTINVPTSINGTGSGLTIYGGDATTENLTLRANSADTTTGQVYIATTTAASSTSTGALNVTGGVGIVGNLHVGGTINVPTSINGTGSGLTIYGGDASGENLTLRGNSAALNGSVLITNLTTTVSKTTGALVVSGGLGIDGNFYMNGIIAGTTAIYGSGTSLTIYGGEGTGQNLNLRANSADVLTGSVIINTLTSSTSSLTGSLVTYGGQGILDNLNIGYPVSKIYAGSLTGSRFNISNDTLTDTSSSGIVANTVISAYQTTALAASSVTTYTDVATLYIAGAPTASTNVTLTNAYSLWIDAGTTRLDGALLVRPTTNQIVLGVTNTTTISATAPAASRTYTLPDVGGAADFVMTAGTQTIAGAKTFSGITTVSNATSSTSTTTGALVVTGGIGTAENLNVGGTLKVTGEVGTNADITTGTWTGFAATAPSIRVHFRKVGNLVYCHIKSASGTSNSASFTSAAAVPSGYRPADDMRFPCIVVDNGTTQAGTLEILSSSGDINIGATTASVNNFTTSGTKAIKGIAQVWTTDAFAA